MADDCKRTLDFTVPLAEVESETTKAVLDIQKKVRMDGFRPGKAPLSVIRKKFQSDIQQAVLEAIAPRYFKEQADKDNIQLVGQPGITDVHFHDGEPLKFTVEFEVAPEFDLGDYRGIEVIYNEPVVTSEDVDKRLDAIRNSKAEFVNVDPRPLVEGDYAVVSLRSTAGLEGEPISSDESVLEIGKPETMPEFNQQLPGMSPGESKSIDVTYPENYGNQRLSGKTVTFEITLKGLRRKDLPEVTDEFAADLGDYKTVDELNEEIRKTILRERESQAQESAKTQLIDKLVDAHNFPVPNAYLDRQIEMTLESRFREIAAQGIDPRQLNLDWKKLREAQVPGATRDVKASILLEKIADREAIATLADEVDKEIQRFARQMKEPPAAIRMKFEKDGTLSRIANRIRTEKVLNFLFEQSTKVAGELPVPAEATEATED